MSVVLYSRYLASKAWERKAMLSKRTLALSATLICTIASLASCSDDDDLLNGPGADAAGSTSRGGASVTGVGGRGGSTGLGGAGGVTTGPASTGGSTALVTGGTSAATAGAGPSIGGLSGTTSSTSVLPTGGGGGASSTAPSSSALGGASLAGASGLAGAAGSQNQAGAVGVAGAAGAPQKSALELACESVCAAQSSLSCAVNNCASECEAFGANVDDTANYLAMVQCEAQSITTADGYFCSDQNPMVPVGQEGPSPKVQGNSACRTEICAYTCNESTFYDTTVCEACACEAGC